MIATYGTIKGKNETNRSLDVTWTTVLFKYPKISKNHFNGRHVVDDNNKLWMQPIAFKETWDTVYSKNRIFSFFMALSAVNAQYAHKYFGWNEKEPVLLFCHRK